MFIKKYVRQHEFLIVSVLLLSAVLILSTLLFSSGPRLSSVKLEQNVASEQIILTFSTPLDSSVEPEIAISPQIDFQYIINGEQIVIRPKQPLAYDTSYALTVSNVQDSRGKSSVVNTTVSTKNPRLFFLKRDQQGMDAILQTSLSDQTTKTVFEAPTILDYTLSSTSTLIITEQSDKSQQLIHQNGRQERVVTTPENHKVIQINGSSTNDSFVLLLQDTATYRTTAYTYTAQDGLLPIKLGNESHLEASWISYAPDGLSYLYRSAAGVLYIDDPSDTSEPLSLGTVEKPVRFLPDSSGIFIFDTMQFSTIDAQSGQLQPAPDDVQTASSAQQYTNRDSYTYITQGLNDALDLQQNIIVHDGNNAITTIFQAALKDRLILQLSLSPNDQFVITEESSQPVIFDGASLFAQPTNIETYIRNADGSIKKSVNGFKLMWRYDN